MAECGSRRKSGNNMVVTNARPPIHQTTPSTCKLIAMAMIYPVEVRLLANGHTVHQPRMGYIDASQLRWRRRIHADDIRLVDVDCLARTRNGLLYAGEPDACVRFQSKHRTQISEHRMSASASNHKQGIAIAASGTLILSFDAVLVRLAATSQWNVVFWRGLLIFVSLLVYQCVRSPGRRWLPGSRGETIASAAVMFIFAANMALFVISVSNTLAANTVVILSSSPFFAALFSWLFLHERIAARTAVAIVTAIAGVVLIFGGSIGAGTLFGDLCAVAIAVLM